MLSNFTRKDAKTKIFKANALSNVSLRGVKRLRGKAEANLEIPRFARNRLRNLRQRRDCHALRARNDM